jgi:hypothetical protein
MGITKAQFEEAKANVARNSPGRAVKQAPAPVVAAPKDKNRQRVSAPEKRTYKGRLYHSASEMRFAQWLDAKGFTWEPQISFNLYVPVWVEGFHGTIAKVGEFTIDFSVEFSKAHKNETLVEIKAERFTNKGRRGALFNSRDKLRWVMFRTQYPHLDVKLMVESPHGSGNFVEVRSDLRTKEKKP